VIEQTASLPATAPSAPSTGADVFMANAATGTDATVIVRVLDSQQVDAEIGDPGRSAFVVTAIVEPTTFAVEHRVT